MSPAPAHPIGKPRELSSQRLFCNLHFAESGASLHSACQHASPGAGFGVAAGIGVLIGVAVGDATAFAFAYSSEAATTESRNCLSVDSLRTTNTVSALSAIATSSPI